MEAGTLLKKDAENNGIVEMQLPADQLINVVDMLRNESPVFIGWQTSIGNAYLATSHEPVGEGE